MKLLYKKILELLKPYKLLEFIGIVCTFAYAFFTFLTPKISEYLIDNVIPAKSYKKLIIGVTLFVFICVSQPIVGLIKDRIFIKITENITYDIRKNIFEKVVCTKFSFFDEIKGGDLISIIMNDGRSVSDFISNIFAVLLKNVLLIIMISIGMLLIDVKISFMVALVFMIFIVINIVFKDKIQSLSKKIQENYDELCSYVNQTNTMIIPIKMNSQEKKTVTNYEKIIGKMKNDNKNMDNTTVFVGNLTTVIIVICLGIIYALGAFEVIEGRLSMGNVIALGLYFQLFSGPIYELMGVGININAVIPIFERIDKYMNLEQEKLGEYEGKLKCDIIDINHLKFSYMKNNRNIIDDIKLSFPSKGLILLIGESGSGKSTIIKLLMGMYEVENGRIMYGKRDINSISRETLRRNISYVPQECKLMNDTVYNNIVYGVEEANKDEVIQVCKRLKIHGKIISMEHGYDTEVTERVNLSGGEAQRILLARAILKKAPIFILDEPLSNLDSDNSRVIIEIVSDLACNNLIIMITHQEIENIDATKVFNVVSGKIIG